MPASVPRQLMIAAIALFIIFGPAYRHLVERPSPELRWLRGWQMYSRHYPVCVIRFENGGAAVDRLAAVGSHSHDNRLLKNEREVRAQAATLCQGLEGDVDLRVYGRCNNEDGGWLDTFNGEEDLCP